jgi:hypothetical protein
MVAKQRTGLEHAVSMADNNDKKVNKIFSYIR